MATAWTRKNTRKELDKDLEDAWFYMTHTYKVENSPKVRTKLDWIDAHSILCLEKTSAKSQHQMDGALLLDVVICERAAILELLACKDEALLVGRDALLVLNLRLDIVDRVARLNLERDRLPCESLYEDLHF